MRNESLFRNKPVWQTLITLAVPSILSIMVMVLYNMADMFFVACMNDTAQVAAVSVVGPVFSIVAAVATMLGSGGCSVIAKAAGAGEIDYARTCASLCGWAFILFGGAAAVVLNLFTDPLLGLLGATPEMLPYAGTYLRILAIGAPAMLLSTGFAQLMRAEGEIRDGFIGNLLGTAVNLVLDPLFILVLHLGVIGAAVATVLGNLSASAFYLRFIFKHREGILNIVPARALKKPSPLFRMMALGMPEAISSLLSGFASTFSNGLLNPYGTNALAAMGAAGRVTQLIFLIQMGICMGSQSLMAYNCGARNLPRIREILQKLAILTVGTGVVTTATCTLARHTLIGLFLRDAGAAALGEQMVIWLLLAGPVVGLYYLSSSFLQATGNAVAATTVTVLRQGALLIPCLYLLHALIGFTGIAAAYAVADITSAVIALSVCLWQYRQLKRSLAQG